MEVTKPESCYQSQESSEQCTGLDFYNSQGLRQEFGSARSEPIVVTIGGYSGSLYAHSKLIASDRAGRVRSPTTLTWGAKRFMV